MSRHDVDCNEQGMQAAFSRQLLKRGDRTLIQSTCAYCGVTIVGSLVESLAEDEVAHYRKCPALRAKAANRQA